MDVLSCYLLMLKENIWVFFLSIHMDGFFHLLKSEDNTWMFFSISLSQKITYGWFFRSIYLSLKTTHGCFFFGLFT
jgi:hypothetical protein